MGSSVVPDVFVVTGTDEVPRFSYKIWEVGIVPQFVMEVASAATRRRDRDVKYSICEQLGFLEVSSQSGVVSDRLADWS